MGKNEGVIKYRLEHQQAEALPEAQIRELNKWRQWMYARGLIGTVRLPEGEVGFGNISCRVADGFIITGSQTGGLTRLSPSEYVLVTGCWPEENRAASRGPLPPSSEALTHAALYQVDESIAWVMHAHHAAIWQAAERLELPMTDAMATYGTPEMAIEITRLFAENDLHKGGIFAMGGHQDGIVSFGSSGRIAADRIQTCLDAV
jgi:ribulose-5-phosphate 4-epimerase/fuculose-1-phosphate aldolase